MNVQNFRYIAKILPYVYFPRIQFNSHCQLYNYPPYQTNIKKNKSYHFGLPHPHGRSRVHFSLAATKRRANEKKESIEKKMKVRQRTRDSRVGKTRYIVCSSNQPSIEEQWPLSFPLSFSLTKCAREQKLFLY